MGTNQKEVAGGGGERKKRGHRGNMLNMQCVLVWNFKVKYSGTGEMVQQIQHAWWAEFNSQDPRGGPTVALQPPHLCAHAHTKTCVCKLHAHNKWNIEVEIFKYFKTHLLVFIRLFFAIKAWSGTDKSELLKSPLIATRRSIVFKL